MIEISVDISEPLSRFEKLNREIMRAVARGMKEASNEIFVKEIKAEIVKKDLIFEGRFYRSIKTTPVSVTDTEAVLHVGSSGVDHAGNIELGTPPGMPDMAKLRRWVRKKLGIRPRTKTTDIAVTERIADKMQHEGVKAQPTIEPTIRKFGNVFGRVAAQKIRRELAKL